MFVPLTEICELIVNVIHFTMFLIRKVKTQYCFIIRDRFRTVVNVLGDAIGSGIVHHLSRDELRKADQRILESDRGTFELLDGPQGRYTAKKPDETSDEHSSRQFISPV